MGNFFTQGGQTQLHKVNMFRQVFNVTLMVSLLIGVGCFLGLVFYSHTWQDIVFIFKYHLSGWRLGMNFLPKGFADTFLVPFSNGSEQWLPCHTIFYHPENIRFIAFIQASLLKKLLISLGAMVVSFCGFCFMWVRKGKKQNETKIVSGQTVVTSTQLKKLIKKRKCDSDLELAGVPLLRDAETEHMLISGTTGSGKTNAMNELLTQIRKRGDKVLIVDTTCGFVERFYEEGKDKILNPLDKRSQPWNLWEECYQDYLFDDFAESVIPQTASDPFWSQAARTVLTSAARSLNEKNKRTIRELVRVAVSAPLSEAYPYFKKTIAASMMHPSSDKTALSIRSTLAAAIRSFEFLKDAENPFSIRRWIQDDTQKGWLFLSCTPEQRSSLRPLISGWLSLATKALAGREEDTSHKIWVFIDELPSLNQIPDLPKALAEVRKYGGCFVLGVQNVSQMDDLYGHNITRSICGLTGTKLIFRSPDSDTCKRMSQFLGEQEIIDTSESISFGAHQMRDGVSLSEHRHTKPIVPYSELMSLPNLQAFLQVPQDLPVAKIAFIYHVLQKKNPGFIEEEKPAPESAPKKALPSVPQESEAGEDLKEDDKRVEQLPSTVNDQSISKPRPVLYNSLDMTENDSEEDTQQNLEEKDNVAPVKVSECESSSTDFAEKEAFRKRMLELRNSAEDEEDESGIIFEQKTLTNEEISDKFEAYMEERRMAAMKAKRITYSPQFVEWLSQQFINNGPTAQFQCTLGAGGALTMIKHEPQKVEAYAKIYFRDKGIPAEMPNESDSIGMRRDRAI